MFRNQYLAVTNRSLVQGSAVDPIFFNGLYVYAHNPLAISIGRHEKVEILLIGHILNPLKPDDDAIRITNDLALTCTTPEVFLKEIQIFSGRFVFIYKNGSSFLAVGDTCCLRHIYYGQLSRCTVLTSSPRMFLEYFGLELQVNKDKRDFINSAYYKKKESAWVGDKCIDDRLRKVLPNHHLDLSSMEVTRTPLYPPRDCMDREDLIYTAASILKGTFTALVKRHRLMQPLTAGWDSRILLSASREHKGDIQYYIFTGSNLSNSSDVRIANNLAEKLGLNLEIIQPDSLSNEFLQEYAKEHVYPRILPKTAYVQYHYHNSNNPSLININGNGGEITRCYYGSTSRRIPLEMLHLFSGYPSSIKYVRQELEQWSTDARTFANEQGIPLLDLFYWEQRMGNWGALYPFEQDIALEEISPFSNKSYISALLSIKASRRRPPYYTFHRSLIHNLWPEALSEPVNPDRTLLDSLINSTTYGRFYLSQGKRFLKKLTARLP